MGLYKYNKCKNSGFNFASLSLMKALLSLILVSLLPQNALAHPQDFDSMPKELIQLVMSNMSPKETSELMGVSKAANQAGRDLKQWKKATYTLVRSMVKQKKYSLLMYGEDDALQALNRAAERNDRKWGWRELFVLINVLANADNTISRFSSFKSYMEYNKYKMNSDLWKNSYYSPLKILGGACAAVGSGLVTLLAPKSVYNRIKEEIELPRNLSAEQKRKMRDDLDADHLFSILFRLCGELVENSWKDPVKEKAEIVGTWSKTEFRKRTLTHFKDKYGEIPEVLDFIGVDGSALSNTKAREVRKKPTPWLPMPNF